MEENGYAKFSWKDGNKISSLILQWLFNPTQGGTYQATQVTFPLAFTTLPIVITTNIYSEDGTVNNSDYMQTRYVVSLFQRALTNVRISSVASTNIIAIGH